MSPAIDDRMRVDEGVVDAVAHALGPVGGTVDLSADGLIVGSFAPDKTIVIDVLRHTSAPALAEAWERLRACAEARGATPVVVVPHATASIVSRAAAESINWMDLAGNARIAGPGLLVHVEGKKRARALRLAPDVDPFARRSANLVRLLLVEPGRPRSQKDLVEASGLSQSRVSKVLSALGELALVRRDENGQYLVDDADALLHAWADVYSYRRQEVVPAHMSGSGIELARDLQDRLGSAGVAHWFTGLPAAWAYDQFSQFRLVSVFVDGDPDRLARDLGLRTSARGANVHLIVRKDQRVEIGEARPQGLRCVHPTQVYLDLLGLPERASEAADHLLPIAVPRSRGG
jgi:hypothetical protein